MTSPTRSHIDRRRRGRLLPCALAAAVAVLCGGCNIGGPVYYAIAGPGKVPREYQLDKSDATVLFIDDPSGKAADRRYRTIIGETAERILLQKGLVNEGNMISTRSATAIASRGSKTNPISIREVGETVGADVVVYAMVREFNRSPASTDRPVPSALLHVKVIDVATGERLWPAQTEGYPLMVRTPPDPSIAAQETSEIREMREGLADYAGTALAELFYSVEIPLSHRRY